MCVNCNDPLVVHNENGLTEEQIREVELGHILDELETVIPTESITVTVTQPHSEPEVVLVPKVVLAPTFQHPYNCGICDKEGEEMQMKWTRRIPNSDEPMKRVCSDCATSSTTYCECCGKRYHNSYIKEHKGTKYCSGCYGIYIKPCVHCYVLFNSSDMFRLSFREGLACESCFDEYHHTCVNCRTEVEDGHEYCDECNPIGKINQYSYKPHAQFFKTIDTTKFFGIELEVECCDSPLSTRSMARKIIMPEIYFKTDGSLNNGFEIVSHPMSYEYIKKNRERFNETMFKPLKDNGYKSYETKTCGIHIHISRNSFSTWHLYRFMKFFSENQGFILKISQRLKEKLDEWATLDEPSKTKILRKIKNRNEQENRYMAINLRNKHTIEVRIFRGTLNINSFFKNIQFIESLYWFTKDNSADKVTLPIFLEYIEANKAEYRDLHKFINSNNYKTNKLPRKGEK